MPKADSNTIQTRFYTVGYCPNKGRGNPKPQLTIKGHWLAELGFYSGMPVTIKTEQGKLVIDLAMRV